MADSLTAPPLVPASIAEAHRKIKPYIHVTPLITSTSMNNIASHPDPSLFLSVNPPSAAVAYSTTTAATPYSNGTKTSAITSPLSTDLTPKFNLYFKCENQQKIGAFKARGAHHALIRLISTLGLDTVRSRGVLTHSSGNHAQALALASRNFGVPSYIIMPTISTPSKIAGTQMYSDHVVFCGSTADEREKVASDLVAKTGAILVPPYDHPDIVLGQGTAAFEMEGQFVKLRRAEREMERDREVMEKLQQQQETVIFSGIKEAENKLVEEEEEEEEEEEDPPRFDAVLTPLGGGGLLGGTATWFSHTNTKTNNNATSSYPSSPPQKRTLIYGTEPSFSGANDAELGLLSTPPTRIPHVSSLTIADGLRTPLGHLNWSIISDRSKVAGVFSVTEDEIKMALRLMMERTKLFLEPSAVVPVAVVLFNRKFRRMVAEMQEQEREREQNQEVRAWDVGIILSGGNTTLEALGKLFAEKEDQKEQGGKVCKNEVMLEERQTGQIGMDGKKVVEDVAG